MGLKKDYNDKFTARTVILSKEETKTAYAKMCKAIGTEPTKHLRENMEAELALYESAQVK